MKFHDVIIQTFAQSMFLFHSYECFVVRCHLPTVFVIHDISEFICAPIIVSLVVIMLTDLFTFFIFMTLVGIGPGTC
jgi:hypothetical protein